MNVVPRLAVTAGEPAGIGPDLIIQLAQQSNKVSPFKAEAELVVIADKNMLEERIQQLALPVNIIDYDANAPIAINKSGEITVLDLKCPTKVIAGQLNADNSQYVLDTLEKATKGCVAKEFAAIVTAPLHKGIINDAGIHFTGHTEFLAKLTKAKLPVMMLAAEDLRVALVTTHLPLKDISRQISKELLTQIITILDHDLKTKFGLQAPRILICGLNPHAGEDGHLGMEEIDVIEPVINTLNSKGMNLHGPLPADTLFTPKYLETADAVLAMYHDQGLPVLKHVGFGNAVNITLGLPIIRTSVDHGTALDLAGTGKANTGSLEVAINTAIDMIKTPNRK